MLSPIHPPIYRGASAPKTPPEIANLGTDVAGTSYYASDWHRKELPYLSCHRGVMRLFGTGGCDLKQMHECHVVLLTRGFWEFVNEKPKRKWTPPPPREMLELLFYIPGGESPVLYLDDFHCNRFPGWQPGKRCWELHHYAHNLYSLVRTRRWKVYWRTETLPCLRPWEGPPQDPRQLPPH